MISQEKGSYLPTIKEKIIQANENFHPDKPLFTHLFSWVPLKAIMTAFRLFATPTYACSKEQRWYHNNKWQPNSISIGLKTLLWNIPVDSAGHQQPVL